MRNRDVLLLALASLVVGLGAGFGGGYAIWGTSSSSDASSQGGLPFVLQLVICLLQGIA
jgi:hypothetical protein